jgi:hypothetical protein
MASEAFLSWEDEEEIDHEDELDQRATHTTSALGRGKENQEERRMQAPATRKCI